MTERAYRLLLRAYPRSLRSAHGEEMVALVHDRRTIGREPAWRLWPSLLADTVGGATAARWEQLMAGHRALVLGGLGAVIALAIVSDGLPAAAPIVVVLGVSMLIVGTWRAPVGTATRQRSGTRWAAVGAGLLAAGVLAMALIDREATAVEWSLMFGSFMAGLFALATGLGLLATQRRRPVRG